MPRPTGADDQRSRHSSRSSRSALRLLRHARGQKAMMSAKASHDSRITRLAKALQHPVRVRIVEHLRVHDTASPSELASAWGISLNVVSYHCRRLERLGLIRVVRRIQRRGAIEHRYALVPDALGDSLLLSIAPSG